MFDLMHGYDEITGDLSRYVGWQYQEKFRGVRFVWDGTDAYTRNGNRISLPDGWAQAMPSVPLDCELYDGPYGERRCASAVRFGPKHVTDTMQIIAFDCPEQPNQSWEERIAATAAAVASAGFDRLTLAAPAPIQTTACLKAALAEVLARDGEGLMLRQPESRYIPGRQRSLVKLTRV
jgi:DNA ligase-1